MQKTAYEMSISDWSSDVCSSDLIAKILRPVAKPLEITAFPRPHVVLVVGVNGSGKTTTIAKLAHLFTEQDYSVMLAAGDTFRAAAIRSEEHTSELQSLMRISFAVFCL